MNSQQAVRWFKYIAFAEGISFLVLLFIAMPLKYLAGMPVAVKLVGWLHGALFVSFVALMYSAKQALGKNYVWMFWAFIASVLPFGSFLLMKTVSKPN